MKACPNAREALLRLEMVWMRAVELLKAGEEDREVYDLIVCYCCPSMELHAPLEEHHRCVVQQEMAVGGWAFLTILLTWTCHF